MAKKTSKVPEGDYADWLFPILIIVVLVGFLGFVSQPEPVQTEDTGDVTYITIEPPYSFEEMFYEMRRIDARFATDFRNESLEGGPVLRIGGARQYIGLLGELRTSIANKTVPEEDKYIHFLIDAREHQLQSEIYFQQAMEYGTEGIFRSQEDCDHAERMMEATNLFNLSRHHGGKALLNYDRALALKTAWPLIGVNENKPAFYSKIFIELGRVVDINSQATRKFCYGEDVPELDESKILLRLNHTRPIV